MSESGQAHTPVTVREMHPEEADAIGALTLASYDAYGAIRGPYRDFLADPRLRARGCTALLVAVHDGTLVGTVTFVLPGDEAWEGRATPEGDCGFRVLAVAPEAEGRGAGRALVEACLARARERGCHRVSIMSMRWMQRALELYPQLGFVQRPDLDVRFPGGDGVAFTLDLTDDAPRLFPAPGPTPDPPPWFEAAWAR